MPPTGKIPGKSPLTSTVLGRVILLLLWWMPCLPSLWNLLLPEYPSPISGAGIGILDSNRTQILILSLAALAISGWRPRRPARWNSPTLPTYLFIVWLVLSSLFGGDTIGSLFFIQGTLSGLCVLLAARRLVPKTWSWWHQYFTLQLPVLVVCVVALEPILWSPAMVRAAGAFQLPGALSNWLILLLPVLLESLRRAEGYQTPVAALSVTLVLTTIVFTISRAAWLLVLAEIAVVIVLWAGWSVRALARWALSVFLGLLLLVSIRHNLDGLSLMAGVCALCFYPLFWALGRKQIPRNTLLKIGLVAILLGGIVTLVGELRPENQLADNAQSRLDRLTGSDNSAQGRWEFWRAAVVLANRNPMWGVGPGRFGEAYPQAQRYYYYFSDSVHGSLLEMLSELGWVGGGLFLISLLAFLAETRPNPWRTPEHRGPMVGLVMAALYAQVEVGYHFAIMWTSFGLMLALATPASAEGGQDAKSGKLLWLWLAPVLTLLAFIIPWQWRYENATRHESPLDAYLGSRQVSDRLSSWAAPALSGLQFGLRSNQTPSTLQPLAVRALARAPLDAVTYQLVGEIALREKDYPLAKARFLHSLELDRFNFPASYRGLLLAAMATNDQKLIEETRLTVLRTYDLSKWEVAHLGHRENLVKELVPLLYDIADSMSPYKEPRLLEPIYRFLVGQRSEPRALHGLGISLWSQGKTEEGRAYLEQAHTMDSSYPVPKQGPAPNELKNHSH